MCHEMIHYWVNSRLDIKDGHGILFIEQMNRINKLGYNVSLTDEDVGAINQELSTSENIFITGNYSDKWKFAGLWTVTSIKKLNATDVAKSLEKYNSDSKFHDVKWYLTTAPETKQLQASRKLDKYSVLKPQYNYLLENVVKSPKTQEISMQDVIALSNNKITESVHAGIDYDIKINEEDDDGDRINIVLSNTDKDKPYLIGKVTYEKVWQGLDMIG